MTAHPTQLFALLLEQKQTEKLINLVNQSEAFFKKEGTEDTWFYWKALTLILSGEPEQALTYIPKILKIDEAAALEIQALRIIASKTNDSTRYEQRLEQIFGETKNPLLLYELCELKAGKGEWKFIADHSDELVRSVSTYAALRLAAYGLNNAGQARHCLDLLENNTNLFPSGQLPIDLRRIRISCEQKLGLIVQALKEAESLVADSGHPQDKENLITLKLASGDSKAASLLARDFLSQSDVPEEHLLRVANLIHFEDLTVAQDLLNAAIKSGKKTPELLAAEIDLSYRLGVQHLSTELLPLAIETAKEGKGPMKAMSFKDMIGIMTDNQQKRAEFEKKYQQGELPIHLLSEVFGGPTTIASLIRQSFHPIFKTRSEFQHGVFIGYGGRNSKVAGLKISRLFMDITALLIAVELDILETVEKEFAPIQLPPSVNNAILWNLQKAAHPQPQRLAFLKLIREFVDQKKIKIADTVLPDDFLVEKHVLKDILGDGWIALLNQAKSQNGFLVDFLPITRGEDLVAVNLPSDDTKSVIGIDSIFEALALAGKLSQVEHASAQSYLKNLISNKSANKLSIGASLFLHGNIIESIISANLLSPMCANFSVHIEKTEFDRIKNELIFEEWNENHRQHLKSLLEHIRQGLRNGKYELVSLKDIPALEVEERIENPESQILRELLSAECAKDSYVWVDDRFLTSYRTFDQIPIITVYEMLSALRDRQMLNENEFYLKLNLIRATNCRFVPFEEKEVLHHLKIAAVNEGVLIETPELIASRKYAATCILAKDIVQSPLSTVGTPLPNCPQGELQFAIDLHTIARQTIHSLWNDHNLQAERVLACADWVLQNFWFNMSALPRVLGKSTTFAQQKELLGSDFVSLLVQGLGLPNARVWDKAGVRPPRERYIEWLFSRYPQDPSSIESYSRQLRKFLIDDDWMSKRSPEELVFNHVILAEFLDELPTSLKDLMHLPLHKFGKKQFDVVEAFGCAFKAKAFWKAAERAIRKGSAELSSIENNQKFHVKPEIKDENIILSFHQDGMEKGFVLSDPAFNVVDHTVTERFSNFKKNRIWFDMPDNVLTKKAQELANIENAPERMLQLNFLRKKSPAFYYERLLTRLKNSEKIPPNDFAPPSIHRLIAHLRLPSVVDGAKFDRLIAQSASILTETEGFFEAFRRLSTLPVSLPKLFLDQYRTLEKEKRNVLHIDLMKELHSPISKIQYLWLMLQSADDPETISNAEALIKALFSEEGEHSFEAFKVLLQWTFLKVQEQAEDQADPAYLLAVSWTHAVRLHNVLSTVSPQKTISNFFQQFTKINPKDAFQPSTSLLGDIVHPRMLKRATFLSHGIMSAIGLNESALKIPKLKEEIEKLCFYKTEKGLVPTLEMIVSPSTFYDNLCSFLSADREQTFTPLLGAAAKTCSASEIREHAETTLSVLVDNQNIPDQWILLNAFIGPRGMPESLKEKATTLIQKVKFIELSTLDDSSLRMALFWISNEAKALNREDVSSHVKKELYFLARHFSAQTTNPGQNKNRVDMLVEAAHFLIKTDSGHIAAIRNFVEIISTLRKEWLSASDHLLPLFRNLIFSLPVETADEVWPLVLELRKAAN